MSLNVLTQGGGAGGASASIFVTGLSEADAVTAVKNGKTIPAKWNSAESRFEITKIKEYGTWTVTTTDGEKTTEQDVLVDAAVEFEIEMGYDVYISDNFEGTSLNTDLWTWRADYTANYTVNNGITITNGSDTGSNTWEKISYLQLNEPFDIRAKRITASLTITNLTGTYREATISMFTGQNPDAWESNSVPSYKCGVTVKPTTYVGNRMSIKNAELVSSGNITAASETLPSFTFSYPTVLKIIADIEERTFEVYQDNTSKSVMNLPSNMELAAGKPFLFITAECWYACSISLSNVTVEIEY